MFRQSGVFALTIFATTAACAEPKAGLNVDDITPEMRKQESIPAEIKGAHVKFVIPGSDAEVKGVTHGSIITHVDSTKISDATGLVDGVKHANTEGRRAILVKVYDPRTIETRTLSIQLKELPLIDDLEVCRGSDCDKAIGSCTHIISNSSLSIDYRAEAYQNRAYCSYATGQVAKVMAGYKDPNFYLDQAINDYNEALRLKPGQFEVLIKRGDAFQARGRNKDAIGDYDEVIRLRPDDPLGYKWRGNIRFAMGDYDNAIHDYDRAIRLDPDNADDYEIRANVYFRKGQYDKSVSDYNQAIQLKPDYTEAYYNCAEVYRVLHKYDQAIADYDKFVRLKPEDADAYKKRGEAYRLMGQYDRAVTDYDQFVRLRPNDAKALVDRGVAHGSMKQYRQAFDDCNEATRLRPDYAAAYNCKAWYEFKLGMLANGLLDADKSRSLNPKDFNSFDTRGNILLSLGQTDAALDDFSKAISLGAKVITTYFGRGRAYEQKGLIELAMENYRQALQLEATDPDQEEARTRAQEGLTRLSAVAGTATSTHTVQRIAMVIGNSSYVSAPHLNNALKDAKSVAAAFQRLGFSEVIELYDLDEKHLVDELKTFGDKAAQSDWAVVFFAGHGVQVDGQSYLIPIDAKLLRASHVVDEAVPIDRVLAKVADARQMRLVILDACRNNPFLARMVQPEVKRSLARGLAPIEKTGGVLVVYSARDGQVAEDGAGEHSPFTQALLENLEQPGVEIGLLFRKVRDAVLERTGGLQEPATYGSIPSEGFFSGRPSKNHEKCGDAL